MKKLVAERARAIAMTTGTRSSTEHFLTGSPSSKAASIRRDRSCQHLQLRFKNCLLPSLFLFLAFLVVFTGGLEPAVVRGVNAAGVCVEVDGVHLVLLHLGALARLILQ